MEAKQAAGALLTVVGVLLILYAIYSGFVNETIGSTEKFSADAAAMIVGWFAVLIGPALLFGETPAAVKKAAGR
ncbi:hypothetical protein apy_05800 [Aeropyrum pernix]|uniref:Uncharacterized protein n=1 Tax=Aeropyrum pernix TaxID=56636 RepID=A0A401H8S8_AERPX|nr:hypothetical protein [Aeropyrum pernix]GBF08855.1 hypothetical protein apy_05800 [Aeropyrum pernix]